MERKADLMYEKIMTVVGRRKEMVGPSTANVLLTWKTQVSGCVRAQARCSSVLYRPDMTQTKPTISPTTQQPNTRHRDRDRVSSDLTELAPH